MTPLRLVQRCWWSARHEGPRRRRPAIVIRRTSATDGPLTNRASPHVRLQAQLDRAWGELTGCARATVRCRDPTTLNHRPRSARGFRDLARRSEADCALLSNSPRSEVGDIGHKAILSGYRPILGVFDSHQFLSLKQSSAYFATANTAAFFGLNCTVFNLPRFTHSRPPRPPDHEQFRSLRELGPVRSSFLYAWCVRHNPRAKRHERK